MSKREAQLKTLGAAGHSFDLRTGLLIADRLQVLIRAADTLDAAGMFLLRGAAEYFLLVDDAENDIKGDHGFDDDLSVMRAVEHHLNPDN